MRKTGTRCASAYALSFTPLTYCHTMNDASAPIAIAATRINVRRWLTVNPLLVGRRGRDAGRRGPPPFGRERQGMKGFLGIVGRRGSCPDAPTPRTGRGVGRDAGAPQRREVRPRWRGPR